MIPTMYLESFGFLTAFVMSTVLLASLIKE
jgi:hypothetical protein